MWRAKSFYRIQNCKKIIISKNLKIAWTLIFLSSPNCIGVLKSLSEADKVDGEDKSLKYDEMEKTNERPDVHDR